MRERDKARPGSDSFILTGSGLDSSGRPRPGTHLTSTTLFYYGRLMPWLSLKYESLSREISNIFTRPFTFQLIYYTYIDANVLLRINLETFV